MNLPFPTHYPSLSKQPPGGLPSLPGTGSLDGLRLDHPHQPIPSLLRHVVLAACQEVAEAPAMFCPDSLPRLHPHKQTFQGVALCPPHLGDEKKPTARRSLGVVGWSGQQTKRGRPAHISFSTSSVPATLPGLCPGCQMGPGSDHVGSQEQEEGPDSLPLSPGPLVALSGKKFIMLPGMNGLKAGSSPSCSSPLGFKFPNEPSWGPWVQKLPQMGYKIPESLG